MLRKITPGQSGPSSAWTNMLQVCPHFFNLQVYCSLRPSYEPKRGHNQLVKRYDMVSFLTNSSFSFSFSFYPPPYPAACKAGFPKIFFSWNLSYPLLDLSSRRFASLIKEANQVANSETLIFFSYPLLDLYHHFYVVRLLPCLSLPSKNIF